MSFGPKSKATSSKTLTFVHKFRFCSRIPVKNRSPWDKRRTSQIKTTTSQMKPNWALPLNINSVHTCKHCPVSISLNFICRLVFSQIEAHSRLSYMTVERECYLITIPPQHLPVSRFKIWIIHWTVRNLVFLGLHILTGDVRWSAELTFFKVLINFFLAHDFTLRHDTCPFSRFSQNVPTVVSLLLYNQGTSSRIVYLPKILHEIDAISLIPTYLGLL